MATNDGALQQLEKPQKFAAFCALWRTLVNEKMADLMGSGSNHLTQMLMEWNDVLRHSSLGCGQAQNTNEREDGSAPYDSRPAVGRRRKLA